MGTTSQDWSGQDYDIVGVYLGGLGLPSLCLKSGASEAPGSHLLCENLLPRKDQIHVFLLRSMTLERGALPLSQRDVHFT